MARMFGGDACGCGQEHTAMTCEAPADGTGAMGQAVDEAVLRESFELNFYGHQRKTI